MVRTPSYACKPMDVRVEARQTAPIGRRTLAWPFADGHGIVRPRGCGGPPG